MPRIRRPRPTGSNKKIISEGDLKKEVVNAIIHSLRPQEAEKMISSIRKAKDPAALEGELIPIIQRNMERIVEIITDGLVVSTVEGSKKYELYYKDPADGKEIPFDVDYATDLKCGDEAESEEAWSNIWKKSENFLKKALGEDNLAKAFYYIFAEYALTSKDEIFEKYTPGWEKEKAEERSKKWEEMLKKEKEERKLEEGMFEKEPGEAGLDEEELEMLEDLTEGYGLLDEEGFLYLEDLETDFEDTLPEFEEYEDFEGGSGFDEEESEKEEDEDEE
jgi:hypothetical protein